MLKEIVTKMLHEAAQRVDNGTCELSDEEMYECLK
jgi:hypothetical protein